MGYFKILKDAQTALRPSGTVDLRNITNYNPSSGTYSVNNPAQNVMVGLSPEMRMVFHLLNSYANSSDNVLILGASGTGKELAAEALHYNSPRYRRGTDNFVVFHCSSIPDFLIESELFGYVSGAHNGPSKTGRLGAFQRATDGTIVLDEIADMPYHLQPRLLRVVADKKIKKVGSDEYMDLGNIKIVASTNQDLVALVRAGRFRHELLHRFSVLPLYMPTLSERGLDDITALVRYFATGSTASSDLVSDEALQTVMSLNFPGNARTLENMVKQAKVLGEGRITSTSIANAFPYIQAQDAAIPLSYEDGKTEAASKANVPIDASTGGMPNTLNLKVLELWAIAQALVRTNGIQKSAAPLLGITARVLNYKMMQNKKNPSPDADETEE